MKKFNELNDEQFDVLREIANIGAGNAATSLSKLLNQKIDLFVPSADFIPFENVTDFLGGEDQEVFAVFIRLLGRIEGNLLLFLTEESAVKLLTDTTHFNRDNGFSDYDLSVLKEIGNILSGAYVTALSDMTDLEIHLTPPQLQKDISGAVLDIALIEYGEVSDGAILLNTSFMQGDKKIEGIFAFLPSPNSLSNLFEALGVPLDENN